MFSSVGAWLAGLSNIGKLSLAGSAVVGTALVGSAVQPPSPDTSPAYSQQQTVQEPVVTTKVEVETETIAFESRKVEDSSLAKGKTEIRTAGVDGVKTITHTVTLADGVEIDRVSSEKVTLEPVTEVLAVGTYVAPTYSSQPASRATSSGVVKMSRSGICHAPGTTYYSRTIHYTGYDNLDACLSAGGRLPRR